MTEAGTQANPTVSVVVTTRNRAAQLREALDSIFTVDRDGFDLEVIVVDDGSTDDTPSVLTEYDVTVVTTSGGVGVGNARTAGMKAATGDFIQMLDDDDVLLPHAIGAQLESFAANPEFGAVHARLQMTDDELVPLPHDPAPEPGLASGWILRDLLAYWPQVGTVLTRAEVAREIGYVKPLSGDSEWDFFLQTAARHPVGRIDDVVMLFRQRTDHAEEEQQWRRGRATAQIWRDAMAHFAWHERLALRPVKWKIRGWHASIFVMYAIYNRREGEYRRAAKSLWYGLRWSPPHTVVTLLRSLRS